MYKTQKIGQVTPTPAFSGVGMISREKQEVGAIVGRMKDAKPMPKPKK